MGIKKQNLLFNIFENYKNLIIFNKNIQVFMQLFMSTPFIFFIITLLFSSKTIIWCDAPEPWQLKLQDPSSSIMEGILMFNKHLLFIVILIVCLVGWLLFNTIKDFDNAHNHKAAKFFHSNPLEIIWTSIPALILLTIASPSFTLLYSMDEISEPELSLKVLGHQWYWSYEISDFNSCNKAQSLKYTCYMLPNDMSIFVHPSGLLRTLETYKRVVLPTNTHIRLLVSATDVLHSWTIPSFGLKVDACPGRLNQMNLFIKRFGVFFGQCSEICGVNHGFMPIVILTVPSVQYHYLIMTNSLLYENIES